MSALDDWHARRELDKKRARQRKVRPKTPTHVRREPCRVCQGGPTQVHHIVPRSHFRSTTAKQRHMNDPANLMPLCGGCHQDHHTTAHGRVPRSALRDDEIAFVRLHMGEGWLDRWYPVRELRIGALPSCTYCGKNEADEIGVIIEGACGDCRRVWR